MVDSVPVSVEAMYETCDHIIEQQIIAISHGRCPQQERQDIKQNVYVRAIQKHFLARTRELFATRGGGSFERSLFKLTQSVTVNHFERTASRPLHYAVSLSTPEQIALLDGVLADQQAIAEADAARHQDACEELDAFGAWLQTRRGKYARARRVRTIGGARDQQIDITEVFRLWRLYGESRHVTRQIAVKLQLTEKWVRDLKARLRKSYAAYRAM